MRAVLPGKPPAKLQALSTALWDGIRVVVYISGNAIVILGGAQNLLQTIYVDDTDSLSAVVIDEASGKIAVCGGRDIFVYHAYRIKDEAPKWSLAQSFRSEDEEPIGTLSWGSPDELLVGNSRLTLWFLTDSPRAVWTNKLANPVKFAQFSADAGLVATTGHYDPMVKIWRRLAFGASDVRFEVFYLRHPTTVTGIHWRNPYHREQSMESLLYTICADNKIRIWAPAHPHSRRALQLWGEIDMVVSIQPRHPLPERMPARRYCFIIDSRDFSAATERAVERDNGNDADKPALEHLIEVANRAPEVCVVMDGHGHMSAWGLENAGCRIRSEKIFNIVHVEGLNLPFAKGILPEEDYVQFHTFSGTSSEDSFTILAHCFDGRIEWFDSKVDVLFDPTQHKKRLTSKGTWAGHDASIKKVIRNANGRALVSRTNNNLGLIWKQKGSGQHSALVRRSTLFSDEHIHRTTLIGNGKFLVNLHHHSISLWDTSSFHAERLAICDFDLESKPLCVLLIPTTEENTSTAYVATIGANMRGITWEVDISDPKHQVNGTRKGHHSRIRQFSSFTLGLDDDLAYVLPVDPAGSQVKISGFLDLFAADIALSYTHSGTVRTWTAKVDKEKSKIDWLSTSTVETGIPNISLASGSSIRKAALVGQDRTHLTIWDTSDAQLEFEERFSEQDVIRDLDWTSTPDIQSILAVGFPHKVILMSQLRYDYLDAGPSWAQIREIRTRDLTPHPIGDSCWLDNGNLVIGAGNQLFVYDKHIEASHHLVSDLRLSFTEPSYVDLFDVVGRLNGSLPVFHPQFLAQCILAGKTALVHTILMNLHRKLKFFSEGDGIDGFLDIPLEVFYRDSETPPEMTWKEMRSSEDPEDPDFSTEDESEVFDDEVASIMNENLKKVPLPQLSSKEQFRLVDTIECVATVEKHRRSMDSNAARYLLFFRQHMLRKSQGLPERITIPWREIVWAFHSESQDILADLVTRQFNGKILWEHARESGIFMWMTDLAALRRQLEVVARNEYTKTEEKNPIDCSLYYIALKKKSVLMGLWRMASWNREQGATQRLLAHDFEEARWKTAALKNAFALLGKRRFQYAAAFFLLAGNLRDAAYVCINQLEDAQLAIAITRASEGDDGPVLKEIIEEKILPESAAEGNRWLATWAFWMLNRRDMAVRSLISPVSSLIPPTPASPGTPGTINLQSRSFLSNDPALVVLYKQLREKTLQTLKGASQVPAREEWEFVLRNARLYDRMGCDLLALDLVRHWEFLRPQPSTTKQISYKLMNETPDPQKILKRRSSLVIADMPIIDNALQQHQQQEAKSPTGTRKGGKPPPTVFEEPASNSLLDSFGF